MSAGGRSAPHQCLHGAGRADLGTPPKTGSLRYILNAMPAYRFPVLVVRDAQGKYTASLVEGPTASAVADAPNEALGRIREFLEWSLRRPEGLDEPDFHDGELAEVRVEVRPE